MKNNLLKNKGPASRRRTNASRGGFTLIETLVAIAILSLAITGPMVIAQKGIGSAIYARDEVTAFYLAQEAVEYIRSVRDTNRIIGYDKYYTGGWLWQFANAASCLDPNKCQIDATINPLLSPGVSNGSIITCPVAGCAPILFNSTTNLYGYASGGAKTQFTRTVDVKTINSNEAAITVNISWQTGIYVPHNHSQFPKIYLPFKI